MNVKSPGILVSAIIICMVPVLVMGGWIESYGGEGEDAGRCVRQTPDGGFIVVGNTTTQTGDIDVWLLRTDVNGDTFWTKTFGNEEMNVGYCVNSTSDSGYIVGTSHWLIKLERGGNELWRKDLGAYYVEETLDGGYILAATSGDNVWLVKTNDLGDIVWTRIVESGRRSSPRSIMQTTDGGYVVAAYQREIGFTERVWKDYAWFFKTDNYGNIEWQLPLYEGDQGTRGYSAAQTSEGGYIFSGKLGWDAATATYLLLVKTDSAGDVQWEYNATDNPIQDVSGYWVTPTYDGGCVVADSMWTLFKVDFEGSIDWTQDYQRSASFVSQTADGGFILTGSAEGDLYILRTNPVGDTVSVAEDCSPNLTWEATPIGKEIILFYENHPDGFHAQVFDVTGRRVDVISSPESAGFLPWGAEQAPGVYFITETSSRGLTRRVILVK